jgi:hypothetical protein
LSRRYLMDLKWYGDALSRSRSWITETCVERCHYAGLVRGTRNKVLVVAVEAELGSRGIPHSKPDPHIAVQNNGAVITPLCCWMVRTLMPPFVFPPFETWLTFLVVALTWPHQLESLTCRFVDYSTTIAVAQALRCCVASATASPRIQHCPGRRKCTAGAVVW